MRTLLVAAVVALSSAVPASASIWPAPPQEQSLHVLKLSHAHARTGARSCMAREERAKVARWLAPVACEQPPRSQQLLLASLFGD